MLRTILATSIVLALLGVSAVPASGAAPVLLSDFPRERIAVESRTVRRHLFEAWRAESPRARAQGLMFVKDAEMRPDQAMIFVYDPPEMVGMWMKNTLLVLDILFVDSHGCVVTIKERAQPGNLDTISSRVPVSIVVELKGGTVAERGIRAGDRVVRIDADWPRGEPSECTHAR